MLKLHIVGRRRPGTTLAQHRHHIRQVHGELVQRFIQEDAEHAPRRYAQNAVVDGFYRASAPGSDPLAQGLDFVTQVWVPDLDALARSRRTAFYQDHLRDDEDRFVDQASVLFLPSVEREVASTGPVAPGAWKLFVLCQRAPDHDAAAFSAAWLQAAAGTPATARRHVQNEVLSRPGTVLPVDAIDEIWFDDEAAAHAGLATWQLALQQHLVSPGIALAGSLAALIAREDLIHPGAV
jgi:hypothetical protein